MKKAIIAVAIICVLAPARDLLATFHLMRIRQVMAGAGGDATIQFVELEMVAAGQTFVGGHSIVFFDANGNQTGKFTFPGNVTNGAVGSSILVGTAAFAAASTVAPDFTMPQNIMAPAGAVEFDGSAIDPWVFYGDYKGSLVDAALAIDYVAPAPALPVDGLQSLLRVRTDTPFNNSTDYALSTPAPRNNAGQTGKVNLPGGSGNRFLRGDSNGDGKVDLSDGIFALNFLFLGGSPAACAEASDANSDGKVDITDAVFVLAFLFQGGDPPATPFPACDSKPPAACGQETCKS